MFITGELKIMESFHSVADVERIKNNAIKTWLRQFRNLTYDAEDCIEVVVDFHWVFINRCILGCQNSSKLNSTISFPIRTRAKGIDRYD